MIKCFTSPPENFKPSLQCSAVYVECANAYLLLESSSHKAEPNTWGVPAGKHEPLETPIAAAVRELYEESGIQVSEEELKALRVLYFRKPNLDFTYHAYHLWLDSTPEVMLSDEHQNFKWVTIAQAKTMPLMNGAVEALDFILS